MKKKFRFIESIRVEDNVPKLLDWHQKRVNETLRFHGMENHIHLEKLFLQSDFQGKGVYKWRVVYDEKGVCSSAFQQYFPKKITRFRTVDASGFRYPFKYEDRHFLEQRSKASYEDFIFLDKNNITDSSFSNLVFYDGKAWFTPKTFLLNGVQRQFLLATGRIFESSITVEHLSAFTHFKLINAMLPLEEATAYEIGQIIL